MLKVRPRGLFILRWLIVLDPDTELVLEGTTGAAQTPNSLVDGHIVDLVLLDGH